MDSRLTFRPRQLHVITYEGTLERMESDFVDWSSNRVGVSRDGNVR